MVYLLDVNLLLALDDKLHPHHDAAQQWFKRRIRTEGHRWATSPITENGFVRIVSNPNYPTTYGTVAVVATALEQLCADAQHDFWPDDISLRDTSRLALARIAGPQQLTDVYLLRLAVARGERLATLERSFPATAVHGGSAALERVALLTVPGLD